MNPPVATPFLFTAGRDHGHRRHPGDHAKKCGALALALITALLAQAGIYLMLYAPFVAGVQIILYAGASWCCPVCDHADQP